MLYKTIVATSTACPAKAVKQTMFPARSTQTPRQMPVIKLLVYVTASRGSNKYKYVYDMKYQHKHSHKCQHRCKF